MKKSFCIKILYIFRNKNCDLIFFKLLNIFFRLRYFIFFFSDIHTEEVETNPGSNPAQEPAARHSPCPVGPGPCPVGPGPCPVGPGQEVDWDSEDLTYL